MTLELISDAEFILVHLDEWSFCVLGNELFQVYNKPEMLSNTA